MLGLDYSSEEEEDQQKQNQNKEQEQNDDEIQYKMKQPQKKKKIKQDFLATPNLKVTLAPKADITQQLIEQKEQQLEIYKKEHPELFEDKTKNNVTTGRIDVFKKDDMTFTDFDEQYHSFKNYGFIYDPDNADDFTKIQINEKIHPELYYKQQQGYIIQKEDIQEALEKAYGLKKKDQKEQAKKLKEERNKQGKVTSSDWMGPWANYKNEVTGKQDPTTLTEEEKHRLDQIEQKRKEKVDEIQQKEEEIIKKQRVTTVFHLEKEFDYLGRSYLMPPNSLQPSKDHTCYIPKKCVKSWKDHEKGVSAVRFYPNYGHFLLSASLDGTCKLFQTEGDRQIARTYVGHTQAVRDIDFSESGRKFISAGYDKVINYWDTETGKIIHEFKLKTYPKSARMHPSNAGSSFLVGGTNKKIYQFDLRSGNRMQTYEEHLGGINTICYYDMGKKFVSTSDDNKIFCWETGVPIVNNYLNEPNQQCIYTTKLSHDLKYIAAQQANNKLVIYDVQYGRFQKQSKKTFVGHKVAGYAIGCDFSIDGKFIASGDSDGKAYFWDWKTAKNYRVLDAHNGVCTDVVWHPIKPSRVATCGWDNVIKLWD